MEIIAKTTGGCLIQATEHEVREILAAVAGVKPDSVEIGQKISAIDYALTLIKIKSLKDDHHFSNLLYASKEFCKQVEVFRECVVGTKNILT